MSQFCHDQYDHPLLWCDGKRRIVKQQDALLAMAKVKELKEQDRQKRINEQREVYSLSDNVDWIKKYYWLVMFWILFSKTFRVYVV